MCFNKKKQIYKRIWKHIKSSYTNTIIHFAFGKLFFR